MNSLSVLIAHYSAYQDYKNNISGLRESFTSGYYLNSDPVLKKYEKQFITHVPTLVEDILQYATSPGSPDRAIAVLLLTWCRPNQRSLVYHQLITLLNTEPDHVIHNAVGRAVFPFVVGRDVGDITPFLTLLQHDHELCNNKGAGTLAFINLSDGQKRYIVRRYANVLRTMLLEKSSLCQRPAACLLMHLLGMSLYN